MTQSVMIENTTAQDFSADYTDCSDFSGELKQVRQDGQDVSG